MERNEGKVLIVAQYSTSQMPILIPMPGLSTFLGRGMSQILAALIFPCLPAGRFGYFLCIKAKKVT